MSLLGKGAIAIWNGIKDEARADFFAWHDREHIPERVAIPGFRRGRRYVALEGAPEFFTLYETETRETLTSRPYLERLNAPTDWTRRVVLSFTDTSRSLCEVAFSEGNGDGGLLATWRYDVAPEESERHREGLVRQLLPALVRQPSIVGVHLCLGDRAASGIDTAEKRGRPQPGMPGWVILAEGAGDERAFAATCAVALPTAELAAAGALSPVEIGIYRVQFMLGSP